MLPGFEKIVEERIRMALKNGDFDNLPGAGKPLEIADDSHIPEDLRLAYKILKNADCLPPEVEIRKEIQKTEDLLAGMSDTAQKYRVIKKLNFLIMKLNTMRKSSAELDIPEKYMEIIADRIDTTLSEKSSHV